MNPYNTLRRLGEFNALDATLVTAEASTAVKVKAEARRAENISGAFDGISNVRAWSVDASVEIAPGSALVVEGETLAVIRGENGNYWSWLYDRPGTRKIFYTRSKNF